MCKCGRIGSFVAVLAAVLSLSAREVTVQPVADLLLSGQVWDLSRFEPLGKEIDLLLAEGDSVTSLWSPDTRFDFVLSGDTVLLACEESRSFRVDFTPASVEWSAAGKMMTCPVTARGRMYQSDYISAAGHVTVSVPERVTLITYLGDTISAARLDRSSRTLRWCLSSDSTVNAASLSDSLVFTTRIDRLRLTAPGEAFPRAMKKVVTTCWCGETLSADSTAWIMTSPVAAVPRSRHHDTSTPPAGNYGPDGPGDILPAVSVITGPSGITITPSGQGALDGGASAASAPLRVAVNDIVGRSFIDTYVPADAASVINTSALPHGEYLIQVISGDTPVAAIKYVKQ